MSPQANKQYESSLQKVRVSAGASLLYPCIVPYGTVLGRQWPWYSPADWLLHTPGLRDFKKLRVLERAADEAKEMVLWRKNT